MSRVHGPRGAPIDWRQVRERLDRAIAATDAAFQPSPARARELLEERARLLARPLLRPSPEAMLEVLVFSVGRERYAIGAQHVREVVRLIDFTAVPGLPAHFLGVTVLRGELLPIVDLRQLFTGPTVGVSDLSRVIVLGAPAPELGLLADEAHALVELPVAQVLEPPARAGGINRELILGVTCDALIVLDAPKLLADPNLGADQRPLEPPRDRR